MMWKNWKKRSLAPGLFKQGKILTVLLAGWATSLFAEPFSQTGPFSVQEAIVTVNRSDDTSFEALLYYADEALQTPRHGIVFAHGFLSPPELYGATCRHLASKGFVVIAPRSGLEPFPDHARYARDISDCLTWLEQVHSNETSVLFGNIITGNFGATGHSMGGGAILLAAADDPRITAVAPLAAADTRPSAIEATARIDAPLCFVTGSDDAIVPNFFHSWPMFDQTIAPSLWFDIKGGYHCGFIQIKLPDAVCDEGSISRFKQLDYTHEIITAFFESSLRANDNAWNTLWGPALDLDPGVQVRRKTVAEIDSGITRLAVKRNAASSYTVAVRNTDIVPRAFTIQVSGTFPVTATPPTTPTLAPGASADIIIELIATPPSRTRRGFVMVQAKATENAALGGDYQWAVIRIVR